MRRVLFVLAIFILTSSAFGQTNSGGLVGSYQKWPDFPPVGIGTEGCGGPWNALHIHYDPSHPDVTLPAILRFSQATGTNTDASGLLGLIPITPNDSLRYSSLIRGQDMVLRASHGDLLLTSFWKGAGAIRMATRPDSANRQPPISGSPAPDSDYERLTILSNGNVGVSSSPDGTTHLAVPYDQLQIGGGAFIPFGYTDTVPGLSIYGGNRWEGMPIGDKFMPVDWRYIAFNYWQNHLDTSSNRYHRRDSMSSSRIAFAPADGGTLQLESLPYSSTRGLDDFKRGVVLNLTGNAGLQMWSDEGAGREYHSLFDVWRPGHYFGTDTIRNDSGLFIHYTPVYIGFSQNWTVPNFTNLSDTGIHPTLGDQKTWMLAVNGPALFKEAFVNSEDWPDYVFDPSYQLRPLSQVEQYIRHNHHLPDVLSADEQRGTVSLGENAATSMKKIEELTLYVIQLQKQIEELNAKVDALQKGGK